MEVPPPPPPLTENDGYDVIIVGLGAHGSSSISALSAAKHRVLGLEKQLSSPHTEGSSHGHSRIIRLAYFEDHRYVPLLQRSLELWKELDKTHATGGLLHLCGGLMIGKPDSEVIRGTLESIRVHNLPHQLLTASQIRQRFNVFATEDDDVGVFEDTAGFLVPELCIRAFLNMASRHGATLHFGETVIGWERQHYTEHYLVHTDKPATYTTKKIVLCAGAWMSQLLANNSTSRNTNATTSNPSSDNLPHEHDTHNNVPHSSNPPLSMNQPSPIIPLHIVRRVQYWFQLLKPEHLPDFARLPVYIWDLGSKGSFYGFPWMCDPMGVSKGVKVALHQTSNDSEGIDREHSHPETIDRFVGEEEKKFMKALLQRQIPLLGDHETADLLETATCMYTMTPDTHFIIDFHPGQGLGSDSDVAAQTTRLGTEHHHGDCQNIVIVSACSGHGFKFAPVIGEIVEQLISHQTTSHDISLFSIHRFGIDIPS